MIEAGQGNGRWGFSRIDPGWLLETSQSADFTSTTAATAWNDARNFKDGSFVSACAWDEYSGPLPPDPPGPHGPLPPWPKKSIGGGYFIDCADCIGAAGSGFWVKKNSTIAHGSMQCDHSLPNCCSAGYCGRKDCSGCYRTFPHDWLVVTPRQFAEHFTIGSNFTCALLAPSPAIPVVSGNPSCADYDGVALRVPRVPPTTPAVPTALCVGASFHVISEAKLSQHYE